MEKILIYIGSSKVKVYQYTNNLQKHWCW